MVALKQRAQPVAFSICRIKLVSLFFQGTEWVDLPIFGPQPTSFSGLGAFSTALLGKENKFEVTSAAEHTPRPINQST